ncbi:MAG: phosphoribosylglycinamide formyltransferase [Dissulfurimicrobium sp.]|uniref:phosphoribosylglycinamide formyltransferase n=1 Tax=Dissulfurimicrobium sp. TaxID=2022436 RepID=UPI003D12238F
MMDFGWWTTGRDRAAFDLFDAAWKGIQDGVISGKISYVFCSKAKGEGVYSDRLMDEASMRGLPVVSISAAKFMPELRVADRERWRDLYHGMVLDALKDLHHDIVVLAGYMWVVSARVCRSFPIINLHPALPGGPCGTWQEVIWQLIQERAGSAGAMIHLVTPELDRGPAITYCRFKIRGNDKWDILWDQLDRSLKTTDLDAIKASYGETQRLFAAIRMEGVKREVPLTIQTLRLLANGDILIKNGMPFDRLGRVLEAPLDLTPEIDPSFQGAANRID